MMSWKEKERLQALLKYLEHQLVADEYQERVFNPHVPPTVKKSRCYDVSQRLRDEQGRFLSYNSQTMEESDLIFDSEQETKRKLKIEPITGSYNSYSVDEKDKRDWSGNIYLGCVAAILAIAFFS